MHSLIRQLRSLLIAVTALALSAGLALGAMPPAASTGLANAAAHAGKTVPVAGGETATLGEDEDTDVEVDEEVDEDTDVEDDGEADEEEPVGTEEAGEHCASDPTTALQEELDALNHGAVVCWAAHQAEWPEWFTSRGAFVRCWAHQGKAEATSCTEEPTGEVSAPEEPTADSREDQATATGKANGKSNGKAKRQK